MSMPELFSMIAGILVGSVVGLVIGALILTCMVWFTIHVIEPMIIKSIEQMDDHTD